MRKYLFFYSTTTSVAISAAFLSGAAYAQAPAGVETSPAPRVTAGAESNAQSGRDGSLTEIIVTATRRSDTVNRVPLSISAVTQEGLDQQGIKSASDLQRVVPALTMVNQIAGVGTFAIRGIVANTGAATTGVYLDDTALTKRNNPGGNPQNNGAPLPTLFDLERVEVLKGPQGTLYGGSSQGGTIRFITPTPSLTTYSGKVRAEIATVENGEPSYDLGAALGGPIIEDRLGFRVSGIYRETGGWIDVLDAYDNGSVVREDANSRREWAVRGALKAQLAESTSATLAWYHSRYTGEGGPDSVTDVYGVNGQINPNQTFTTPATCYNNSTRPAGAGSAPAAVACPAVLPAGYFRREAQTYGPFTYLGEDDSLAPYGGTIRKARTRTDVGTLTLDHDAGGVTIRSITSYVNDRTTNNSGEPHDAGRIQTTLQNPGRTSFPLFAPLPDYYGRFLSRNNRVGFQQELRFASSGDGPFRWVGGVFFSTMETNIDYKIVESYDAIMLELYGLTSQQRYGIPNTGGFVSSLDARLRDKELAAFGEVSYAITDKLRAIGGVRISRVDFDFRQENFGQLSGRPNGDAPFGRATGKRSDTPFTPKLGLQYMLTSNDMIYANAAKGFRAGGINVPLNPQVCGAGLALLGLTVDEIPTQYAPDTVWSYEVGGKFRMLDGRLQLNVAAFQIDWTDIQVTASAQGCGQNWNQNGGTARSRGFDVQVDLRPLDFLTINAAGGLTDAVFTEKVMGPQPLVGNPSVTYNEGDPLGVPKWQLNVGGRLDFEVASRPTYLRVDYQFQGKYDVGSGYGTTNYNPFTRVASATDVVNLRSGMEFNDFEVNIFVSNLFASRDKVGNAGNGKSGCSVATGGINCDVYSFYNPLVSQQYQRPRSIGIQMNYVF